MHCESHEYDTEFHMFHQTNEFNDNPLNKNFNIISCAKKTHDYNITMTSNEQLVIKNHQLNVVLSVCSGTIVFHPEIEWTGY